RRAAAVQLDYPFGVVQRAVALGVPAGERVVRGVQRSARHAHARIPRSREPRVHREDQSSVPVLIGLGLRAQVLSRLTSLPELFTFVPPRWYTLPRNGRLAASTTF